MRTLVLLGLALLAGCQSSLAEGAHADPVLPLLMLLVTVLVAAKLGGEIAMRLGQPSVLGELLAGVVLAVAHHGGLPIPDLESSAVLDILARLGVVVLLFEVGLESTVPQLLSVGARATVVAVVGVIAPIAGGFVVGGLLLPDAPWSKPLFLGAAMCATSVGITARVFKDLGTAQTPEARLIVGAAVIDDVLGLVVLSVVSGVALATAGGESLDWRVPAMSAGLAAAFLVGAIVLGPMTSKLAFRTSQRLRSPGLLLPLALSIAFVFAYIAGAVQLAPIVGAYAAGLILERAHYKTLLDRGEHELEELIKPISQFLVPIFFVLMGARVHVWEFTGARVWVLAIALIAVAFVSKLVCALAAPRGSNRMLVGVGMIPRGEVGLIFADAGRNLVINGQPLLDGTDFSSIVMMVAATTLLTPPLLARLAARRTSP